MIKETNSITSLINMLHMLILVVQVPKDIITKYLFLLGAKVYAFRIIMENDCKQVKVALIGR